MKKVIFFIIGLTVLILILPSCEDYLDREPLDRIGNNSYWKTAIDLENYTLQYYASLPSFSDSNHGALGWDASRGSDTQIIGNPSIRMNGGRSPVISGGNWQWSQIRSINIFFDNYRKCDEPVEVYGHFLGEAYFFKAWFYFELLRSYGDVPWFTHALEMSSEELYKPRDSRLVVADSILWSLDQAIKYMNPLSAVSGGSNRLSKEAALLFKSRVALHEGSWQKYHRNTSFGTNGADPKKYFRIAVDAAEELMKSEYTTGLYSTGNPGEDYCKMFSLKDQSANREALLWKRFDTGLGLSHVFQVYISGRTGEVSVTLEQIQHYLDRNGTPYDYMEVGKTVKGNQFLSKISEDCDSRLSQIV